MQFFEKRVQPRTRHRIQVRFGNDREWNPGFITDVSNTGVAILCREKPVTRVVTIHISYEQTEATLACEVRWTELVNIRGRSLTHMGLKIVSAPLDYMDIVRQIESRNIQMMSQPPENENGE